MDRYPPFEQLEPGVNGYRRHTAKSIAVTLSLTSIPSVGGGGGGVVMVASCYRHWVKL